MFSCTSIGYEFSPINSKYLPVTLAKEIFTYLSFKELMSTKRICSWINAPVSNLATIQCVFDEMQLNFTDEIFAGYVTRGVLSRVCVLDLSKTSVNHLKPFLNNPMPTLTTLKFPDLQPSNVYNQSGPINLFYDRRVGHASVVKVPERVVPQVELGVEISRILTAHCVNLTSLDFNGRVANGVSGEDVEHIAQLSELVLPKLRHLNLDGGWFLSRVEMDQLASHSPDLETLSLKNSIGEGIFSHLKFSRLRNLNLEGGTHWFDLKTEEDQENVSALARNCPKLTSLNIPGSGTKSISFLDPSKFNFPFLEHLNISQWKFKGESFAKEGFLPLFQYCSSLRSLDFSACVEIKKEHLSSLSLLRNLTALSLKTCELTDAHFVAISQNCPELMSLSLCNARTPQNEGLSLGVFPKLTYLNLFNYSKFSDTGLELISRTSPDLTYLNLFNNSRISDKALTFLSQNSRKLTYLNLSDCSNISPVGLESLFSNAPQLKELNLGLQNLSDQTLELFILPQLTSLNVTSVGPIKKIIPALKKGCPKLKNLTHEWMSKSS